MPDEAKVQVAGRSGIGVDRPALPLVVGLAFGIGLGVLRGVQQYAPVLFERPTSVPLGWLLFAVGVAAVFVAPLGAAVAGYWLGGRLDVPRDWPSATTLVAVGAFVGALVGFGGLIAAATADGTTTSSPPFAVVVGWVAVVRALDVAVPSLAGACVRALRQT